jgi:hypothetical protein
MIINQILKDKLRRNTIILTHSDTLFNFVVNTYNNDFPVEYTYANTSEELESSEAKYYFNNEVMEDYTASIGTGDISTSINFSSQDIDVDTIGMFVIEVSDQKNNGVNNVKRLNYARILYGFNIMNHITVATGIENGIAIQSFNESAAISTFVEKMLIPDINSLLTVKITDQYILNNEIKDITEIKSNAFYNKDKVNKVILGENIKKIGSAAFRNMTNLSEVVIYAENPPILEGAGIFFGNEFNRVFKVPQNSLELYKNSWAEYATRIEAIVQ